MAKACVSCGDDAVMVVSVLAPTGEVVTTDTGTAPVLSEVLGGPLCADCGAVAGLAVGGLAGTGKSFLSSLGGHVDLEMLDPDDDGMTAAKRAAFLGEFDSAVVS